eukprot:766092-Hanusia_phi.AAC.1
MNGLPDLSIFTAEPDGGRAEHASGRGRGGEERGGGVGRQKRVREKIESSEGGRREKEGPREELTGRAAEPDGGRAEHASGRGEGGRRMIEG